jgi:hypothetical protein
MSDTQHTPAPWRASEMRMDKRSWAELNGDHDLTIVQAHWDGITGDVIAAVWADDDHDELANAHLIAAAPELLAACEASGVALTEAAAVFKGKGFPGLATVLTRHAEICAAALAKARGDQ